MATKKKTATKPTAAEAAPEEAAAPPAPAPATAGVKTVVRAADPPARTCVRT